MGMIFSKWSTNLPIPQIIHYNSSQNPYFVPLFWILLSEVMISRQLYHFGRYIMMMGTALARPERTYMYYRETTRQMNDIGVGSLVIVILISLFIGAVTTMQF